MKEGLAALLVRKTDESRRNAQREIENWRKAIDIVSQAEKQAECRITLPSKLTAPIPKVAEEARVTNHVAAVGLADLARERSKEVIAFAGHQLNVTLKTRKEAEAKAQQEVKQATIERDSLIATARGEKDFAESQASSQALSETGSTPKFDNIALNGFRFGCVVLIVSGIIQYNLPRHSSMYIFMGWLGFLGFFSWLILPLLAWILWMSKKKAAESKKSILMQAAQAKLAQQEAEAEKRFRQRLPALQNAVTNARVQRQRAETAIQFLSEQA